MDSILIYVKEGIYACTSKFMEFAKCLTNANARKSHTISNSSSLSMSSSASRTGLLGFFSSAPPIDSALQLTGCAKDGTHAGALGPMFLSSVSNITSSDDLASSQFSIRTWTDPSFFRVSVQFNSRAWQCLPNRSAQNAHVLLKGAFRFHIRRKTLFLFCIHQW